MFLNIKSVLFRDHVNSYTHEEKNREFILVFNNI